MFGTSFINQYTREVLNQMKYHLMSLEADGKYFEQEVDKLGILRQYRVTR